MAGVFLAVDLGAAAFEAVLPGAGVLDAAAFDPAACVFAFFAGALAVRAAFLGVPDGGVVSGAVTIEQLGSNLEAVALSQTRVEWPDIAESPAEYWARRSALPWR